MHKSANSGMSRKIALWRSVLAVGIATLMQLVDPMFLHAEAFLQCSEPSKKIGGVQSEKANNNLRRAEGLLLRLLHQLKPTDRLRNTTTIQLVNGITPNAYATKENVILINDSLFELIVDDSELTYVLAHELGHLKASKHSANAVANADGMHSLVPSDAKNCAANEEFLADAFAANLMVGLRMDLQAPVRLLQRLLRGQGNHMAHAQLTQLELRIEELRRINTVSFLKAALLS